MDRFNHIIWTVGDGCILTIFLEPSVLILSSYLLPFAMPGKPLDLPPLGFFIDLGDHLLRSSRRTRSFSSVLATLGAFQVDSAALTPKSGLASSKGVDISHSHKRSMVLVLSKCFTSNPFAAWAGRLLMGLSSCFFFLPLLARILF